MCKDDNWVVEYHYENGDNGNVGAQPANGITGVMLKNARDDLTHVILRRDTDEGQALSTKMHEAVNPVRRQVRRQVWRNEHRAEHHVVVEARTEEEATAKLRAGDFETLREESLDLSPWEYVRDEAEAGNPVCNCSVVCGEHELDCAALQDSPVTREDMLDALGLAEATIVYLACVDINKAKSVQGTLDVIRRARGDY